MCTFVDTGHRSYNESISLIKKILPMTENHLYFFGDLINKWHKSLEEVEFMKSFRLRENIIGLNTGCCFDGVLTVYYLETREISQVKKILSKKDLLIGRRKWFSLFFSRIQFVERVPWFLAYSLWSLRYRLLYGYFLFWFTFWEWFWFISHSVLWWVVPCNLRWEYYRMHQQWWESLT